MGRRFTEVIQTRFTKEAVEKMDRIIKRDAYDDRSQFIRLAVNRLIREQNDAGN